MHVPTGYICSALLQVAPEHRASAASLRQTVGSGPVFFSYDALLLTYMALKVSSSPHLTAQIQPGECTDMLLK